MKNFMDENFLLQTETAQKLYHEHAAKMPIIDYHCHLIPQMVADAGTQSDPPFRTEDRRYSEG